VHVSPTVQAFSDLEGLASLQKCGCELGDLLGAGVVDAATCADYSWWADDRGFDLT